MFGERMNCRALSAPNSRISTQAKRDRNAVLVSLEVRRQLLAHLPIGICTFDERVEVFALRPGSNEPVVDVCGHTKVLVDATAVKLNFKNLPRDVVADCAEIAR